MHLVEDLTAHTDVYLALAAEASRPYDAFVYEDADQARRVHRTLFASGSCEYASPYGRLWVREDGTPLGMIAALSSKNLLYARLRGAYELKQSEVVPSPGAVAERMRLARGTLLTPGEHDLYLSRITVAEAARGCGVGTHLFDEVEAEARRRAARRIVFEVSPSSEVAVAFYRCRGCRELDLRSVVDPASNRSLTYLHMAKELA